jgi:hypothetical protein
MHAEQDRLVLKQPEAAQGQLALIEGTMLGRARIFTTVCHSYMQYSDVYVHAHIHACRGHI